VVSGSLAHHPDAKYPDTSYGLSSSRYFQLRTNIRKGTEIKMIIVPMQDSQKPHKIFHNLRFQKIERTYGGRLKRKIMMEQNIIIPANNVKVLLPTCSPIRLKRLPKKSIMPDNED
jgi:hypothetical protein